MSMIERQHTPEAVYHWLEVAAEAQEIPARVYGHLAKIKGPLLIIPVFVAGDLDAFEFASQLQDLEDAWNNQEPKPEWHVILRPAGS